MPWEEVYRIVIDSCTFTQHSIHSARDKWPCKLFEKVLPRHLELIYKINFFFIQEFINKVDSYTLSNISLVEESPIKSIRFSNLSFIMSNKMNGVSELHVEQLKLGTYKYLNQEYPDKIISIFSGVSPRRWIHCANPKLNSLILEYLAGSDNWLS